MRARCLFALCATLLFPPLTHAEAPPEKPGASDSAAEQEVSTVDVADAEGAAGEAPDGTDAEAAAEDEAITAEMREFEASLHFQQGQVTLGDDLASLEVPDSFQYLGPEDADRMLQAWGNPPDPSVLGVLLPTGVSIFDDAGWAVVMSYTEEGHVEDDDAGDIDYDELLADMQSDTEDANEMRREEGYPEVHLLGWAEPPSYDAASKKMYWAKELDFGAEQHTLNYDIRVLGRKGVLEMSAVSSMDQLSMVKAEMPKVMEFVRFNPGNTYADFDPEIDEVAAYGIGALVAGKVAAKAGLFKGLIALLLASKKALVAGAVALFAALKGLLGRRRREDEEAEAEAQG